MHTSAHTTCMSQTVELCGNAMFILIITFVSLLPERLTPVHVTLRELGQPKGVSLLTATKLFVERLSSNMQAQLQWGINNVRIYYDCTL